MAGPNSGERAAPSLALRAGAIETAWRAGRLERVAVDGHEVWHGVHFLLRDPHWRTPALRLGAPRIESPAGRPGAWRLVAEGGFDLGEAVRLRITVEGGGSEASAGRLVFTGEARVERDVEVNRLGLCLLHPLSACGRTLEIRHDDGRLTRSTFPEHVPAWPPFNAIRSMRHEYAPGAWAVAEFEGDVFELEDQRNNADASFKTYSRSNAMPRPYRLRAGDVVRQQVRLRVEGPPQWPARAAPSVVVAWPGPAGDARNAREAGHAPVPEPARIGVEVTAGDLATTGAAAATRAAAVARLQPDHLHVTLSGQGVVPDAAALRLLAHLLEAAGPQAGLRLDIVDLPNAGAAAALEIVGRQLDQAGLLAPRAGSARPFDVAIFPTTAEAVQAARAVFPGARIGGGTRDFFVQLNRAERLPPLDFLSFTVCPIVHAADDETVMLGHASLAGMRATLEARHPGVPVHLGPSSIAARRSPLGDLAPSDGTRRVPLAGADPREHTALGATWVAAHVAAALHAGVRVLTVSRLALCGAGSPTGELLARLGRRARPGGLEARAVAGGAGWVLEVGRQDAPEEGDAACDPARPAARELLWINTTAAAWPLALPEGFGVRWRIGADGAGVGAGGAGERRGDGGAPTLAPYEAVAVAAVGPDGGRGTARRP